MHGLAQAKKHRPVSKRTTLALASALACLLLWGCAAVPLSTMVRMSRFDEGDFAQLSADALRVRIRLPEGFGLDATRSWLGVEIASAAGVHNARFALEDEAVRRVPLPSQLFSGSKHGTEYVLRLAQPSRTEFRHLQAFVSRGPAENIDIRVVPKLAAAPPDAAAVDVWIDLLLSETEGYFRLVDGATLSLRQRSP